MIECKDSLEWLKSQADLSADIIFADPPYALGSTVIIKENGKPDYKKAIDFMNKWKMPNGEYWEQWFKEVYRSLKYGGYCILFGIDRQDFLFKYYANLSGLVEQQNIYWYFISNFPKSSDLSKNIDKHFNAEREVVGIGKFGGIGKNNKELGYRPENYNNKILSENAVTSLAKKYAGYKYSIAPLKQVCEVVMIFQKPYKSGSCLRDTLAYENGDAECCCGALNIDGNRVGTETINVHNAPKGTFAGGELNRGSDTESYRNHEGRYPANMFCSSEAAEILDKQSGVSKSGTAIKHNSCGMNFGSGSKKPITDDIGYSDIGGCSKILHKCDYEKGEHDLFLYQPKVSSGERQKGLDSYITLNYNKDNLKEVFLLCQEENTEAAVLLKKVILELTAHLNIVEFGEKIMVQCHKDFLSIIKTEINKITESKILNWLTHYITKESIQIVNCEMGNGLKSVQNVEKQKKLIQKIGITQNKNIPLIVGAKNAILKMLLYIKETNDWQEKKNGHCCLKPIALNKSILSLFKTPNPQKILFPFAGAGSEIIGAIKAGFTDVKGCEINQEYINIANARIKYWQSVNFNFEYKQTEFEKLQKDIQQELF